MWMLVPVQLDQRAVGGLRCKQPDQIVGPEGRTRASWAQVEGFLTFSHVVHDPSCRQAVKPAAWLITPSGYSAP
jgi:hypothetical protein